MIKPIIAIVFSTLFFALGCSWGEIAIALSIAFVYSYGTIAMHTFVERKTQRKVAPRSEKYAAAYFGIGLGIALVANFILRDSHFLVSTAVVLGGFIFAEMVAHACFGEPIAAKDTY